MLDTPEQWLEAVQLQLVRARSASRDSVIWEIHCFGTALRNLLRSVQLRRDDEDVRRALLVFDSEVPHARLVRDILEHWDEYVEGAGRRQREFDPTKSAFAAVIEEGDSPRIRFAMALSLPDIAVDDALEIQIRPEDLVTLDLVQATRAAERLVASI